MLARSQAWDRYASALVARLQANEDGLQALLVAAATSQNMPAAASALRDLVVMGRAVAKVRGRARRAGSATPSRITTAAVQERA